MARKRKTPARRARRKPRRKSRAKGWQFPWWRTLTVLLVIGLGYVAYLDFQVYRQFEGKRWTLPARVYARPLELYAGVSLDSEAFARELRAIGYHFVSSARKAGEVSRNGDRFHLRSRGFTFWDGSEPGRDLWLQFGDNRLTDLRSSAGDAVSVVRLEPLQIGAIHPSRHEDRVLVQYDQVPEQLVQALVAVEDRDFFSHFGISPRGIARALWANVRAGGVVQGGSTLTQQLVKNFFLTSERSLIRKFNEAIMALLLERRYSKEEILQGYLNEVYLAQDGNRAIHGFGLASEFLFDQPLAELNTGQLALLVGMVKGPSYYDPRRHPERARQRRDLVLSLMTEQGILSPAESRAASRQPLDVVKQAPKASNWVPAFMELLREQLHRDYQEADLQSEGLRIFTTLDPQVQWALEEALQHQSDRLERSRQLAAGVLQGAGIVTSVAGEVLAVTGDRVPRSAGFNRALHARRPVGSLLKPAVFLTALEQGTPYSLAARISDEPLRVEIRGKDPWEPMNYDHEFHGEVSLYQALVHSYNVATARLGMTLGLDKVIHTLERLGLERDLEPYPSLLLGAVDLSPWEVTQMYQTFAAGGFRTPLRAIRDVLTSDAQPLQRYPLEVEAVIAPEVAYLLSSALQGVVREGTGRPLQAWLDTSLQVAGKTGTTDDLRDSWFAGYSGDRLAVIWLGRDDNQPMGLTGASGALQVWGALFATIPTQALMPLPTEDINWEWVDPVSGALADEHCEGAVQMPFIHGSEPQQVAPCRRNTGARPMKWLRGIFGE